ncbi:Kelch repeat-containing protein [Microbulbifer rhizosphaerae]|uniref:BIG2 domain-containing protein n=1 Tax=Microbulbifer rhizosphaerae TaxID=1562603 RepID=A0A7W4Z778_9GAMM|nr:Ig-like domain-containing protein [Microbulbifer rhizosphaerae]MBB3059202.1 hypothetical protein [Microbulbifer rhizosphaerae]
MLLPFLSCHWSRPHSFLISVCVKKFLLILFSSFLLAGCGGGGGGSTSDDPPSPPSTPVLKERKLTFEAPDTLYMVPGDTQENPASAPGSGLISYESDDEFVAVVDSEGTVTAIGAGTTSISATIAEDGEYRSASASYSVEVEALSNTLTFTESGPLRLPVGSTLHNPATGLGDGTVVYSSSDPGIATVDASGLVEAHALGTVTIEAVQEEGPQYLSATASYVIETSIGMTAWAGESDTLVSLSPAATGMNLYRSSERDCDIANFQACENGQVDVIGGTEVVDTAATLERPGYYTLQDSMHEIQVSAWPHHFLRRSEHGSVVFKEKLWIIGNAVWRGEESIWATEDGVVWHPVKSNFPKRSGHSLTVHEGKLFVIGGSDRRKRIVTSDPEMNDVWATEDGINWVQITDNAEFAPRKDHRVVSHNGRLWLIGGVNFGELAEDEDFYYSDVWSSEDGTNWTLEVEETPFANRFDHVAVVHQDRIWVLGGWGRREATEVWVSENGIDWELLPEPAPAHAVAEGVVSFMDRLWFRGWGPLGGYGFWSTGAGESWEFTKTDSEVVETWLHSIKVFKEKLWVTGGEVSNVGPVSSVFSSADATNWKKESSDHPLPRNIVRGTNRKTVVTHKGSYWAFDNPEWSSEEIEDTYIWTSEDGFSWEKYEISGDFNPSFESILTSFNGKLWAIGIPKSEQGQVTGLGLWSSEDGIHWSEVVPPSELPVLKSRRFLVHGGRLWLFGTATIEVASVMAEENQVWSSANGIEWQRESGITEYSELKDYEVASFDGKLWVVGGRESDGTYSRGVWYSSDGKQWQQVVPIPLPGGRIEHRVASYGGKLWLVGGTDRSGNPSGDIWVSENGEVWTEAEIPTNMPPRSNFGLLTDQDGLWVFGAEWGERQDLWKFTEGDGWRAGYRRQFTTQ